MSQRPPHRRLSSRARDFWRSHCSLHEIVRVPEITAVPDSPDYMQGVINLRGKIVSVVDLRKRLGEKDIKSAKKQPHSRR